MTALVEYGTKVFVIVYYFFLFWSFGLHLDENWKVFIFGNVVKKTLSTSVCEKFVPRLNKHDGVIEWNVMKWRAGCALGVVIEFAKRLYFLSSFTAFAELGYHPISILLWTADNWVWIELELFTTKFAVLTLVCAGWTSHLKI